MRPTLLLALVPAVALAIAAATVQAAPQVGDWALYAVRPQGKVRGGSVRVEIVAVEHNPGNTDLVSRWEDQPGPPDPPDQVFVKVAVAYTIHLPWYAGGKREGHLRRTLPERFFQRDFYQELERRGRGYIYERTVCLSLLYREPADPAPRYRVLYQAIGDTDRRRRGPLGGLLGFFRVFNLNVSDLPVDIEYLWDESLPAAGWLAGTMTIREVPLLGRVDLPFALADCGRGAAG